MMAPESERAKMSECVRCKDGECFLNQCPCTCHILNPQTPPTLTCSEVVERLAKCYHPESADSVRALPSWFDREKAAAILHSWRERRVQEAGAYSQYAKQDETPGQKWTRLTADDKGK